MRLGVCLIALCLIPLAVVNAQDATTCKWLQLKDGPILLDSLSVLPSSIVFDSADSVSYSYDLSTGEITVSTPLRKMDSVAVCYVQLPFPLHLKVQNRDLAIYDSTALFVDSRDIEEGFIGRREELFPTQGLEKSGSITRGISVGNTQDVFVNSALNLQLDGKLTDDINIRAVITDQNIPFQPEGNTQHVQDLDRILVEFYNDNFSITAGDIVLHNQPSAFLRYNKQVQGGQATARYELFKNSQSETKIGASIAKGKYASEQVEVKEGVLGPYKLRGGQNEPFVIVLANSEKVYLDGQLLERGYDHDYVIDYNQGEITFTNKVLITRYSRVKVDYEYSDRNYSRSIISGSHIQRIGALNLFANYYNEKDNPNRPLAFDLSDEDKRYLSELGHAHQGVISGADSVLYNPNIVRYKKVDTLGYSPVYVFSTHPDSAVFNVSFSDVGQGNGNYTLEEAHINGRIYLWVAPINGVPQGRYEPIIAIPTPTQKRMFTFGGDYKVSNYEAVFSEMAISDHNNNLFSRDLQKADEGIAYKGGVRSEGRKLPLLSDYKWKAGLGYEFNQSSFRAVDRFRTIEFDRNWNMAPDTASRFDDRMIDLSVGIYDNQKNFVQYALVHRDKGEDLKGYQHALGLHQKIGRFLLESSMFSLNASHETTQSDWKKLEGALSYESKIFVPGYRHSLERNRVRVKGTDSLLSALPYLPLPLHYNEHTFFIKSNDTLRTQFNLYYTLREDEQPVIGALEKASESKTLGFRIAPDFDERHDINFSVTYRILDDNDAQVRDKRKETIMGRLDWYANMLNRHVRSEMTYAIANAQEPKREFVYLKVPTGEGTHTWRDENNDGIQDLYEFYEAINPDERNYIKVFVPTQEYILAYSSNFNYRLNISMPRAWRNSDGLKRFLSQLSNITTWIIDKKHADARASARFSPFVKAVAADELLSVHENFRTTMFYNRSNPKFGMDGGLVVTERKELLTNGFNTRRDREFHVNARANIKRSYNLRLGGSKGRMYNASDFLSGRNYEIAYESVRPEFEWLPALNFRLTVQYDWTDKRNIMAENSSETALIHSLGIEGRYTKVAQRTLSAQLKYINIDFEGEENSAVGYALLNALRSGNNFTWSFNLQQRITEGLQISINYEGRKSSEQDVIHIGRMQVSALF